MFLAGRGPVPRAIRPPRVATAQLQEGRLLYVRQSRLVIAGSTKRHPATGISAIGVCGGLCWDVVDVAGQMSGQWVNRRS